MSSRPFSCLSATLFLSVNWLYLSSLDWNIYLSLFHQVTITGFSLLLESARFSGFLPHLFCVVNEEEFANEVDKVWGRCVLAISISVWEMPLHLLLFFPVWTNWYVTQTHFNQHTQSLSHRQSQQKFQFHSRTVRKRQSSSLIVEEG